MRPVGSRVFKQHFTPMNNPPPKSRKLCKGLHTTSTGALVHGHTDEKKRVGLQCLSLLEFPKDLLVYLSLYCDAASLSAFQVCCSVALASGCETLLRYKHRLEGRLRTIRDGLEEKWGRQGRGWLAPGVLGYQDQTALSIKRAHYLVAEEFVLERIFTRIPSRYLTEIGELQEKRFRALVSRKNAPHLQGFDKVLHAVLHKCQGLELTSSNLNKAMKDMVYVRRGFRKCSDVVQDVCRRLIAGGVAKEVPGDPVRPLQWTPWEEFKRHPGFDAFLSQLGIYDVSYANPKI